MMMFFFDKKNNVVISIDTYVEGVHFLNFRNPYLVIKKIHHLKILLNFFQTILIIVKVFIKNHMK